MNNQQSIPNLLVKQPSFKVKVQKFSSQVRKSCSFEIQNVKNHSERGIEKQSSPRNQQNYNYSNLPVMEAQNDEVFGDKLNKYNSNLNQIEHNRKKNSMQLEKIVFSQLNNQILLCEIQLLEKSKQKNLKTKSLNISKFDFGKDENQRRKNQKNSNIKVLKISENFLKEVPLYDLMQHNHRIFMNRNDQSILAQSESQFSEVQKQANQQGPDSPFFQKFQEKQDQQKRSKHLKNKSKSQKQLRTKLSSLLIEDSNDNVLSEFDQEILELKIYAPYLIQNEKKIELQEIYNNNLENMSIIDILELHKRSGKQKNKQYYKVNKNHDVYLEKFMDYKHLENNINSYKIHPNSISIQSQNSKKSIFKNIDFNNLAQKVQNQILNQEEERKISNDEKIMISKQESNLLPIQRNMILKNQNESFLKQIDNRKIHQKQKCNSYQVSALSISSISGLKGKEQCNNIILDENLNNMDEIFKNEFSEINSQMQSQQSESQLSRLYQNPNKGIKQNLNGLEQKEEQQICYFEFEMQEIKDTEDQEKVYTLLQIKDVTEIINFQMKISDMIYQEAIENNYSHEQMTPLNLLKANSQIIKQKVLVLFMNKEQEIQRLIQNQIQEELRSEMDDNKLEAINALKLLSGSEQASQSLWYYNKSQIQRMKINKNQFQIQETLCSDIVKIINDVMWPFQNQTLSKNINVYLIKKNCFDFEMIADWSHYELILFNLIQNAVKYNLYKGDIIIILSCKPLKKDRFIQREKSQESIEEVQNWKQKRQKQKRQYMLETEVIDTGIGISRDRQDMLFVPFLELKCMQEFMKKPQNDNLGLGLAASKSIVLQMGGDIRLFQSTRALTVFKFKIPIFTSSSSQYKQIIIQNIDEHNPNYSNNQNLKLLQIYGEQRQLGQKIQQYLDSQGLKVDNQQFTNISIDQYKYFEKRGQSFQINANKNKQNKFQEFQQERQNKSQYIKRKNNSSHSLHHQLQFQNMSLKNQQVQNFAAKRQQESLKSDEISLKNIKQNISFDIQQSMEQNVEINLLMNGISNYQKSESCNKRLCSNQHMLNSQVIIDQISEESNPNVASPCTIQNSLHQQEDSQLQQSNSNQINKNIIVLQPIEIKNQNNKDELVNNMQANEMIGQHDLQNQIIGQQNKLFQIDPPIQSQLIDIQYQPQEQKLMNSYHLMMMNHKNQDYKQYYESMYQDEDSESDCSEDCQCQNQKQMIMAKFNPDGSISQIKSDESILIKDVFFIQDIDVNCFQKKNVQEVQAQNYQNQNHQMVNNNLSEQQMERLLIQFNQGQNDQQKFIEKNNEESHKKAGNNIILSQNKEQNNMQFYQKNVEIKLMNQKMDKDNQKNKKMSKRDRYLEILQEEEEKEDSNEINNSKRQLFNQYNNLQPQKDLEIQNQNKNKKLKANSVNKKKICLKIPIDLNIDFDLRVQQQMVVFNQYLNKKNKKPQDYSKNFQQNNCQKYNNDSDMSYGPCSSKLNKNKKCDCQPKVLFVDDVIFNLMAAKNIFQLSYQFEVDEATSGFQAIDLVKQCLEKKCNCKNRGYKIIFMDLQMPEMEGTEAAEKILELCRKDEEDFRQDQGHKDKGVKYEKIDCTIIALSSYTGDFHKNRAFKAGMKEYLNKPLAHQDLDMVMDKYFIPQSSYASKNLQDFIVDDNQIYS